MTGIIEESIVNNLKKKRVKKEDGRIIIYFEKVDNGEEE